MLKTIILDNEITSASLLECAFDKTDFVELIGKFNLGAKSLDFAKSNPVDMAFINVEAPKIDIEFLKQLKEFLPNIIIVVTSKDCNVSKDAMKIGADYFMPMPYSIDDALMVLDKMRVLAARLDKKVSIRTFGFFDIFVNGKPIHFSSSKSKELLAYLVDRNGGIVTSRDGFSTIWEDKPYDHNIAGMYRRALSVLKKTLKDAGADEILLATPNGYAINRNCVDCDYFKFLDGNKDVIANWNGEYLTNYSWGEYTLSVLLDRR